MAITVMKKVRFLWSAGEVHFRYLQPCNFGRVRPLHRRCLCRETQLRKKVRREGVIGAGAPDYAKLISVGNACCLQILGGKRIRSFLATDCIDMFDTICGVFLPCHFSSSLRILNDIIHTIIICFLIHHLRLLFFQSTLFRHWA